MAMSRRTREADQMANQPLVSVVMAVRLTSVESERYFRQALESILNQTYTNFEFIIIDGSPPDKRQRVADSQLRDHRIRVYREDEMGLVNALNMGCRIAKGKYVARMDADDTSMPTRLQKQVAFLERHPQIGILGTWVRLLDQEGKLESTIRNPTNHALIAWSLIFGNCVTHSTVMMKRDLVEALGFYHKEKQSAEDYDLWARASFVTKIANLPEPLGCYRVYPWSLTATTTASVMEQREFEVVHFVTTELIPKLSSAKRTAMLFKLARYAPMTISEVEEALSYLALIENALISKLRLTAEEEKLITRDAEQRILLLAMVAAKRSVREGIEIMIQARRLLPKTFRGPTPLFSRGLVYNLLNHDMKWWGNLLRVPRKW